VWKKCPHLFGLAVSDEEKKSFKILTIWHLFPRLSQLWTKIIMIRPLVSLFVKNDDASAAAVVKLHEERRTDVGRGFRSLFWGSHYTTLPNYDNLLDYYFHFSDTGNKTTRHSKSETFLVSTVTRLVVNYMLYWQESSTPLAWLKLPNVLKLISNSPWRLKKTCQMIQMLWR